MDRLILDTGVLIRRERTTPVVSIDDDDDVAIAAITAAELLVGVLRADERRRPHRQAFVERVLETVPVVEYGLTVAQAHAELLAHVSAAGRRRGAHDLIVAATARAEGRTVITTDRGAFDDLPGVRARVV